MKNTLAYAFVVVLALAAAFAGWQLRGCSRPDVRAPMFAGRTDTVYRDRPIAPEDTATTVESGASAAQERASTPRTRVVYETRTDTVRDCWSRPVDLNVDGLVSRRPLRVEPGGVFSSPSVTLTTWQPDASRFEQSVYDVPRPDWELYPYGVAGWGPLGFRAGAGAGLRWKRLELHAGYRLAEGGRRGMSFGVRVRPFTLDW